MVIITHTLYCQMPPGEVAVPIAVEMPVAGDRDWSCHIEIGWPGEKQRRKIFGLDALQSLTLALQFIGMAIYYSDYHKEGRLRAYEKEQGYGFPLPNSMRHLLVGVDAL